MLTISLTRIATSRILYVRRPAHNCGALAWTQNRVRYTTIRVSPPRSPYPEGQQHRALAKAATQTTIAMNDELTDFIRRIHASPMQGVFYATGGGMQVHC